MICSWEKQFGIILANSGSVSDIFMNERIYHKDFEVFESVLG
jgi:hypothetical protein